MTYEPDFFFVLDAVGLRHEIPLREIGHVKGRYVPPYFQMPVMPSNYNANVIESCDESATYTRREYKFEGFIQIPVYREVVR